MAIKLMNPAFVPFVLGWKLGEVIFGKKDKFTWAVLILLGLFSGWVLYMMGKVVYILIVKVMG